LHHWDSVLIKPENDNSATSSLKKALFENKQVSLSYEGKENHFLFNPYGMVIRDSNLLSLVHTKTTKNPIYWQYEKLTTLI